MLFQTICLEGRHSMAAHETLAASSQPNRWRKLGDRSLVARWTSNNFVVMFLARILKKYAVLRANV